MSLLVPRQRLVEAHARNAMAHSIAEVSGPGLAGLLIKLVGAPLALLADAVLLFGSAAMLRGLLLREQRCAVERRHFGAELREGLRFVLGHPVLLPLSGVLALWQFFNQLAMVVHILVATRQLGLSEQQVGLSYIALGAGSVLAGVFGHRISSRVGPGRGVALGIGLTGVGWLLVSLMPAGLWGVTGFIAMLMCFAAGAVLLMINYIGLRQAVTPQAMQGRMTTVMRWLALLPAGPGALGGGYLGEHFGLTVAPAIGGVGALSLAAWVLARSSIRRIRRLPTPVE